MRLGQCRIHAVERFFSGCAMDDQFGDHGVIKRADGIAFSNTSIDTHCVVGAGETAVLG